MSARRSSSSATATSRSTDKRTYFERNDPFALGLWMRIDRAGASGPLLTRSGGVFDGNRGYESCCARDGTLQRGAQPRVSGQLHRDRDALSRSPPGGWHHLAHDLRRLQPRARPSALLRRTARRTRASWSTTCSGASSGAATRRIRTGSSNPPLRIGRRHDETLQDVSVDELRVYDRQLTAFEVARWRAPRIPSAAVAAHARSRRAAMRSARRSPSTTRSRVAQRVPGAVQGVTMRCAARRTTILTFLPEVMAMRELPTPRPTFVLARGAYDAPTERVTPGTPRAIGDFPSNLPQNRLGLARWLLNPRHPLTARVIVNRYWAMFFGRGLVATLADFGNQGRLPSHPAAARLAGDDVRRIGLEPEGAAEAHRAVGHLPAGVDDSTQSGSSRIPRTSGSRAGRRIGWPPSRSATAHWRPAGSSSAPSAGQASIRTSRPDCGKRSLRGTRPSTSRARGRPLSPQPLHRLEAVLAAAVGDQLRRGRAAVLHGQPPAHQYAAPVAGAAERSAVSRGLARARPSG